MSKSTDTQRKVTIGNTWAAFEKPPRYKAKPGRKVTKKERPTYDLAHRLMLARIIDTWNVYEDGWVFTRAGVESRPMTLVEATTYVELLAQYQGLSEAA